MAIFGNFKGTTVSDFKIGKSSGNRISTGTEPSSDLTAGDLYIDSSNTSKSIYWQCVVQCRFYFNRSQCR